MHRDPFAAILAAVAALSIGARASAQAGAPPLKLPQASPAAKTSLDVGTTTIEIAYHRPALRGRDVWKELGDTKQVWRLGANEATTINFGDPVKVGGMEIPAGKYALFARVGTKPGEKWTLLLNKNPQQWGAYFHDDKLDLLRFEVEPKRIPRREWFSIVLDPKGERAATVTIAWDELEVAFDVEVDVERVVEQQIEKKLKALDPKDWDTRLAIASHWLERKQRMQEALDLLEAAVAIEANFWTLEWNARALHELGDAEAAIPLLERAIEAARGVKSGGPPSAYTEGLVKLLAEWQKQ